MSFMAIKYSHIKSSVHHRVTAKSSHEQSHHYQSRVNYYLLCSVSKVLVNVRPADLRFVQKQCTIRTKSQYSPDVKLMSYLQCYLSDVSLLHSDCNHRRRRPLPHHTLFTYLHSPCSDGIRWGQRDGPEAR